MIYSDMYSFSKISLDFLIPFVHFSSKSTTNSLILDFNGSYYLPNSLSIESLVYLLIQHFITLKKKKESRISHAYQLMTEQSGTIVIRNVASARTHFTRRHHTSDVNWSFKSCLQFLSADYQLYIEHMCVAGVHINVTAVLYCFRQLSFPLCARAGRRLI